MGMGIMAFVKNMDGAIELLTANYKCMENVIVTYRGHNSCKCSNKPVMYFQGIWRCNISCKFHKESAYQ